MISEKPKAELKLCPFCGKPPKVSMLDNMWQICCDIVSCSAYPSVLEDNIADAEKEWNTRTNQTKDKESKL